MFNANIIRRLRITSFQRSSYSSDKSSDPKQFISQRKVRQIDPRSRLQTLMDDQVKNKENEENLSDKPVNEEVKTKPFLKMRRRSLSPFSRVQTMIDAKNTDKDVVSNGDQTK